ncbi:MAG: heme biosynthesis protein HemY [Hydrogenophilaceae bacterium]|nr:heme biosynthesis protein HemY [Hydrogenophilaceae bacterium]
MRAALWLLLLFALAVLLVVAARFDQGYVLIVYPPWRMEMSFLFAVIFATVWFFLAYAVVRIMRVALRLPGEVKAWRVEQRKRQADNALCQATAALLAGDAVEARRLADQVLAVEQTALAALIAARAALDAGDRAAAQGYLATVEPGTGQLETTRQALQRQLGQA